MPRATLTIPPAPEHVRTARLVAVAAARRAGLDEEAVDDVRLAVGETAARAVVRSDGSTADVELVLRDEGDRFVIEVRDGSDPSVPDPDGGVALALVRALVPEVDVAGSHVTLTWPVAVRAS